MADVRCHLLHPHPHPLTVRLHKFDDLGARIGNSLPPRAHMRAHHHVQPQLRAHASTCLAQAKTLLCSWRTMEQAVLQSRARLFLMCEVHCEEYGLSKLEGCQPSLDHRGVQRSKRLCPNERDLQSSHIGPDAVQATNLAMVITGARFGRLQSLQDLDLPVAVVTPLPLEGVEHARFGIEYRVAGVGRRVACPPEADSEEGIASCMQNIQPDLKVSQKKEDISKCNAKQATSATHLGWTGLVQCKVNIFCVDQGS